MAQAEHAVWADFAELRDYVANGRNNTIDKLKRIIDGINDECRSIRPIPKHGKKQDLIDRILAEMNDWHAKQNTEVYGRAKDVVGQVRDTGRYEVKRGPPITMPAAVYPHTLAPGPSNVPLKGYGAAAVPPYQYNGLPRAGQPAATSSAPPKPGMRFTTSPFFRVEQQVSGVIECTESISAMDRRSQVLSFALNADHVQKLSMKPPRYQLRLFCTSSVFYSPARTNQQPCPVEFPPTCEVRVNGNLLTANLKGLKKKPGTAPPADLGTGVRLGVGSQNKVEMIYVNSQQPVQHKKFYLIVQLVEMFSVESVIEKLRKGKYKSKEEIMGKMVQTGDDDDDIVAGPQKMSLKCPLSYVRISIPSRSIKCVHPQCFDANSWFSMMEQTTTWLCPVCEKQLNVEDMIVDGYFDSILQATDEEVEDVMVEADGEWHTTDNKYASDGWRKKNVGKTNGKAAPSSPAKVAVAKPTAPPPAPPVFVKRQSVEEIVILDSDDEDVASASASSHSYLTARKPAPTARSSSSVSSMVPRPSASSSVIDLTIESDEDEDDFAPPGRSLPPAPPPVPPVMKRKQRERSPSESVVKRARFDPPPLLPAGASRTSTPQATGGASSSRSSTYVNGTASVSPASAAASLSRIARLQHMQNNAPVYEYPYQDMYMQYELGQGLPQAPPAPPVPAATPLSFVHPPAPPAVPGRRVSGSGTQHGW